MAKNNYAARDNNNNNAPLSQFGVLVAQLESIVASAVHKSPEPLLCFDLLSDLISAIDEDIKVLSLFLFRFDFEFRFSDQLLSVPHFTLIRFILARDVIKSWLICLLLTVMVS